MESHASGELYWDITAATPPRWIVWLYQPGADPRRLDLRDPSIPQYAPASQLMELISEALCEAMGQRLKVMVDLSLDEPGQRYRFWVTYLSSPDRSTDQQALG